MLREKSSSYWYSKWKNPLKIREKWVFDGTVCKNTLFYYEIDFRGGLCGKLCGKCGKLFKKPVAFATPVENFVENYLYCGKLCGKLLTMWKTLWKTPVFLF